MYNTLSAYFKTLILISALLLTTGWSFSSPVQAASSSVFCELSQLTNGSCIVLDKDDPNFAQLFENAVLNILLSTFQPTITSVSPLQLPQGSTADLQITAPNAHFNSSSRNGLSVGGGVIVNSSEVLSSMAMILNVTVPSSSSVGFYDITVKTAKEGGGEETVTGIGMLSVIAPSSTPTLLSVAPVSVSRNASGVELSLSGSNTHFADNSVIDFGDAAITVANKQVHSNTSMTVFLNVADTARISFHKVTVTTGSEVAKDTQPLGMLQVFEATTVTNPPSITALQPWQGRQLETLTLTVKGKNTHFVNGVSQVAFEGTGLTVSEVLVKTATEATVTVTVAKDALLGFRDVFVNTGAEVTTLTDGFAVFSPAPIALTPKQGKRGTTVTVQITGEGTHFAPDQSKLNFEGTGVTVNSLTVTDATHASATLNILDDASAIGPHDFAMVTGGEVAIPANGEVFEVFGDGPRVVSVTPSQGRQGEVVTVIVAGDETHFDATSTVAVSGLGIEVTPTVTHSTTLSLTLQIASDAPIGTQGLTVTTGTEIATLANAFTVIERDKWLEVQNGGHGTITTTPAGISCGSTCKAPFATGTAITLVATPASDYEFKSWTGNCVDATNATRATVTVVASTDKICQATFAPLATLTVTKNGTGTGTVSSLTGINCGSQCSAKYSLNTTVTLTAVADANSTFTGWSGDCSGTNASLPALTLGANKSCVAMFEKNGSTTYSLNISRIDGTVQVNSTPAGISCQWGMTGDCQKAFSPNTSVKLTAVATPNTGYLFKEWGGDCAGQSNPATLTMNSSKSCTVTFVLPSHSLQLQVIGDGKVISEPAGIDCQANVALCQAEFTNSKVTLTAQPARGNMKIKWSGDCTGTLAEQSVSMTANRSCQVTFEEIKTDYNLQVTVTGSGQVQSDPAGIDCRGDTCDKLFVKGTSVTLTATPATGQKFAGWDGDCHDFDSSFTLQLDKNKTCKASFVNGETAVPPQYHLTLAVKENGQLRMDGNIVCEAGEESCIQTYQENTLVTVTAVPEELFAGWEGDCGTDNPASLTMNADKSCVASFKDKLPPVVTPPVVTPPVESVNHPFNLTISGNGKVETDANAICETSNSPCQFEYLENSTVKLTATPDADWTFEKWSGNCEDAGSTLSIEMTMDAEKSCTAQFVERSPPPPETKRLQVTLTGNGHGTINSDPSGIDCDGLTNHCSYDYSTGTSVTLVATPDDHSTFLGWGENCEGSGESATVTLDDNRTCTAKFEVLPGSLLQFTQTQMTIDEYGTNSTTIRGEEVSGHLVTIAVSRGNDKQGVVSTDYQIVSGNATENQDYVVLSPRTLTWADGDGADKTISLWIVNDCVREGDEQWELQLTHPTGAELGYLTQISLTLQENEATATCDCQAPAFMNPPAQTNLTLVNDGQPFMLYFQGVELQKVSDENVVTVTPVSTGLKIMPQNVGETQFVLVDCAGNQVKFTVTVAEPPPPCEKLALPAAQQAITLSLEEGPQMVTLPSDVNTVEGFDKTIVEAVLTGKTTLQLTPHQKGSTEVTLVGCGENNQVKMKVTVTDEETDTGGGNSGQGENCTDSTIQPASREIPLDMGDSPLTLTFTGGVGEIMPKGEYDEQVITMKILQKEPGFTQLEITPREVGNTQLTLEDSKCHNSQATVAIQVNEVEKEDVCKTSPALQPADSHFTFIKGEAAVSPTFIGGPGKLKLSEVPDAAVVDLELPFYSQDGMTQLTLTPRQAGTTYLTLTDECQQKARVEILVLKPSTLAYYCHLEERTDGRCEHPDNQKVLKSNSTAIDAEGKPVASDAYFEVQLPQTENQDVVQLPTDTLTLQLMTISEVLQDQAAAVVVTLENQNDGRVFVYSPTRTTPEVSQPVDEPISDFPKDTGTTPPEEEPPVSKEDGGDAPLPPPVVDCAGQPPELIDWCLIMSGTRTSGTRQPTAWQLWDGQMANLQAVMSFDRLSAIMEIPLKLELQGLPVGEYTVSIGYRLPNGTVVFNGFSQPRFWIANGLSLPGNVETRAYFAGEVQLQLRSKEVSITTTIKPDRDHLGKQANIVMVALYTPPQGETLSFMRLADHRWLEWDYTIGTLMPAVKNVTLMDNLPVEIFKGDLSSLPGEMLVFVGYEIGETIVFNGKAPIEITLP